MSSAKAALESDTRVLAFEVITFMIFNNLAIIMYYLIFVSIQFCLYLQENYFIPSFYLGWS